jgi:hypothetical protein
MAMNSWEIIHNRESEHFLNFKLIHQYKTNYPNVNEISVLNNIIDIKTNYIFLIKFLEEYNLTRYFKIYYLKMVDNKPLTQNSDMNPAILNNLTILHHLYENHLNPHDPIIQVICQYLIQFKHSETYCYFGRDHDITRETIFCMNLYIKLYVIQLSKTNKQALTRFLTDINSDQQLKQFDIKSYECRIIVEAPNKTNLADINSFN